MKKITFLICALFISVFSYGQAVMTATEISTPVNVGLSEDSSLSNTLLNNDYLNSVFITHSNTQALTNGVSCNDGAITFATSLYRQFDLANSFGISDDFLVTSVEFATFFFAGTGPVNVTVNLYSTSGSLPGATLDLLATTQVVVASSNNFEIRTIPINAFIPAGQKLIYELALPTTSSPPSRPAFLGNTAGATGTQWFKSAPCGAPNIVDLGGTFQAVMNVRGAELTGVIDACATDTPRTLGPGPANGVAVSVNNVPVPGVIGEGPSEYVFDEVLLNIQHSWASDLQMVLVSPSGTEVRLARGRGGSTGLTVPRDIVFRDDSPNMITSWTGGAPLANYRAEGGSTTFPIPFGAGPGVNFNTVFAGESINGNWEVRILDNASGDGGTLNTFCIDFIQNPSTVGTPPQIICPLNITVNTSDYPPNDCGAQVFFANAQAFDLEDGLIPVTQTMGPGTGSVFPVGETIIEFSATDSDGNTSTCQFTVTVLDDVDPIAVCQAITVELDGSGTVMINAADLDGGSSDLCGPVSFSFDAAGLVTTMMFDCSDLGENTITLYVTDGGGNVVTCEAIVTVEDNIAPVIVCANSSGSATNSVSDSPALPILDNQTASTTITLTDSELITDLDVNLNINHTWVGDLTITLESPSGTSVVVFDGSQDGCSANDIIVIFDDESANVLACTPGTGSSAFPLPDYIPSNPLSAFDGEDTAGVWTLSISDSAGGDQGVLNSWGLTYTYDVPGGSLPQYFLDMNGEVTVDINDLFDSVSDNCSVTVSVGGSGGTGPCGFSNASNGWENGFNVSSATAFRTANDLIVADGTDFTLEQITANIFSNGDITFVDVLYFEDAAGLPGTQVGSQLGIVPSSDVVIGGNFGFDGHQIVLDVTPFTFDGQAGSDTTYWIELSVTNTANSGAIFWEITTATSVGSFSAQFDGGWAIIPASDGVYTFSGTCSSGGGGGLTFTCADLGIVNVTVTATDSSGNTTSCVTQIEIIDNIAPIVATEDITVELGPDGTVCIVPEDLFGILPPTFNVITISSDNGSLSEGWTDLVVNVTEDVIVSFDWSYTTQDGALFDQFGYIIDGTFTQLTDNAGPNNQTGSANVPLVAGQEFGFRARSEDGLFGPATITVSNFMPGFEGQFAPANWSEVLTNSDGSAVFVEISSGSASTFDNCGITVSAIDISCFTCADIGTPVTVTLFVSDASGNIASGTAVVTVVDLLAPVIDCPADQTVDTDPGSITYTLPDYFGEGIATATDNCTAPVTILSQTPAPGTLLLDGTYTITLTAEDEYGNESVCSFELTVDTILGDDDNVLADAIVMYPNPAEAYVSIRNNSQIGLTEANIYDIKGKLVSKFDLTQMSGEQRLDVSGLASGVYMVTIQSETASVVKRLIKK